MALGVLDALGSRLGRRKWPLVVGVNAVPEAIAAIESGRMLATASFDAMTMSAIATEAAIRHLRGETVPREIILPVQVVDSANFEKWNMPFEARSCPSWQEVTGLPARP
jgi:ABC-type sugar transport system substrate-binding protein